MRNSIELRGKLEKFDIAYVRTWGEDTTTTEGVAAIQTEEVEPGARVAYLAPVIAVRWVQTDYYARTYDPNNGNYKRGEFVNSSFRMEVSVIRYRPVQANQQPLGDDRDIISRTSGPQW
ncbi:hypothetical protein OHA25_16635 [Nonomuraea sp. NBC_00507]|uniref:hypothetical protein n=1 Tax=Nonomuraea sp. NBC_00507 TaxID=2976002 RepID=UPI002E192819